MTSAGVQKLVKRLGDRAGVTNVHPHRFRRTAATLGKKARDADRISDELLGP